MKEGPRRRRRQSVEILYLSLVAGSSAVSAFQPLHAQSRTYPRRTSLPGPPRKRTSSVEVQMSSPGVRVPRASVRVAIDQPLISDTFFTKGAAAKATARTGILQTVTGALSAISLRTVLTTVFVALLATILVRSSSSIAETLGKTFRLVSGRVQRVWERFQRVDEGIPMPFDEKANDGWGICTLKSKERLGKSNFMQYTFDLPEPDYVLPLDLGQQISMMCLDDDGDVAQGDFFSYNLSASPKPGSFTILFPTGSHEENTCSIGSSGANFLRALKQDVKVGDEIALKPGPIKLSYRGQYLPVTGMVYIACGTGIVPVLDQVRAVLPADSSSVTSVSVVWINEEAKDFDVTAELLEKEYYKYSKKLAVSCVVDNTMQRQSLGDNTEVHAAVPDFTQGTMAVIAGPSDMAKKAIAFLENRGYPRDTICVL
ncbi:predicted protein [Phaeodactylum tricornutum CCAP 1055/1]|uniref:Oxidoreductase FAD/NAD(P)-binding domain-containing protein n=1 Tax=Phaeodactylum tricornutum (strain CCAP 1055/1) TaxID=556484 RepID=B7FWJ3_PHATC|nr:predicted protein [Phaeodactylum tricornutum CCAP 1055/1]EEC48993.1 predicted protein [Phaeodactylum tricornutum CCAP 1055/1]|eukprot:XP_002179170.1 predicted protein [Phaeodactylum tricornutum CCAP 1055/1]